MWGYRRRREKIGHARRQGSDKDREGRQGSKRAGARGEGRVAGPKSLVKGIAEGIAEQFDCSSSSLGRSFARVLPFVIPPPLLAYDIGACPLNFECACGFFPALSRRPRGTYQERGRCLAFIYLIFHALPIFQINGVSLTFFLSPLCFPPPRPLRSSFYFSASFLE